MGPQSVMSSWEWRVTLERLMKGVQHNFHIKSASCSRHRNPWLLGGLPPGAFSPSPSSPVILSHVAALGSRHGMASLPKSQTLYPYTRLVPLCLDCSASLSSWRISTHLSQWGSHVSLWRPPDCGLFTSASLLTYLPNTEVLCVLVTLLGPTPVTPWTITRQAPQSMGFSRQEY